METDFGVKATEAIRKLSEIFGCQDSSQRSLMCRPRHTRYAVDVWKFFHAQSLIAMKFEPHSFV